MNLGIKKSRWLSASLLILATQLCANAAPAKEEWIRLAAWDMPAYAQDFFAEVDETVPVRRLRLVGQSGALRLSRIVAVMANGSVISERRRINLQAGERTKAVEVKGTPQPVRSITLVLDEDFGVREPVKLEVWGEAATDVAVAPQGETPESLTPDDSGWRSEIADLESAIETLWERRSYGGAIEIANAVEKSIAAVAGASSVDAANFKVRMGQRLIASDDHQQAQRILTDAIALYEVNPVQNRKELAAGLVLLIHAHRASDDLQLAEATARRLVLLESDAPEPKAEAMRLLGSVLLEAEMPGQAEEIYRLALSNLRTLPGDNSRLRVGLLLSMSRLYQSTSQYEKDVDVLRQAEAELLEHAGQPDDRKSLYTVLRGISYSLGQIGRYAEAEQYLFRTLALSREVHGADDTMFVPRDLEALASTYIVLSRYEDAEKLLDEAIKLQEGDPNIGSMFTEMSRRKLVSALIGRGKYTEAERMLKKWLTYFEATPVGVSNAHGASAIAQLAQLYSRWGRFEEAEAMAERCIELTSPGDTFDATVLADCQGLQASQLLRHEQYEKAHGLAQSAVDLRRKHSGADHPSVTSALMVLANVDMQRAAWEAVVESATEIIRIAKEGSSPSRPMEAQGLGLLGGAQLRLGNNATAQELLRKALDIVESQFGARSIQLVTPLANLALSYSLDGKWLEAEDLLGRGVSILQEQVVPSAQLSDELTARDENLLEESRDLFMARLKARYQRLGSIDARDSEAFELAQNSVISRVGKALNQLAARSGPTAFGALMRERQDLVGEWRLQDASRMEALMLPDEGRDKDAFARSIARINEIEARIQQIDETFRGASDFSELWEPKPLALEATQRELAKDEALVFVLDTPARYGMPEETFIWVVTQGDVRWMRSPLGTEALTEKVQTLRCGLDEEEWQGLSEAARCSELLGVGQPADDEPMPFHLGVAHELYRALFGEIEDVIKDKRLVIVPSGPLTSLPLHALVTEAPETDLPRGADAYRGVAWLGRRHVINVLPSVGSLKVRGAQSGRRQADKHYIGYGNPVLDGDGTCPEVAVPDACPTRKVADAEAALEARQHSARRSPNLPGMFAGGAATEVVLANVRALCPLPDTAYEIRCVAERFGIDSKIQLDVSATEADIKGLSDRGELAEYRVVHFATHGLLAGDLEVMAQRRGEPALVLTPPKAPKDKDDDGLLTASEVAALKLNAEWVVLSACNTASAEKPGAEALSGLAKAFIYAGARALLVSHWPVYSDAAVRLVTHTFSAMRETKTMRRAEAFQQAMVALMDDRTLSSNAHPAVWAPFVLVEAGDGGVRH